MEKLLHCQRCVHNGVCDLWFGIMCKLDYYENEEVKIFMNNVNEENFKDCPKFLDWYEFED